MSVLASRTCRLVMGVRVCISTVLLILLTTSFLTEPPNRCQMTYMYTMPEYIDVPLPKRVKEEFPNYSLWLYAEGEYARASESLKLSGIPVLFIPGNAGSGKQARSLGSVAMMKTLESKASVPYFDVFTVDFDEELCGLYGAYLWRQTRFVRRAVRRILQLYAHMRPDERPSRLLLVGHSMGGLVARGLFTLDAFPASQVAALVTLGTPHRAPSVAFDDELVNYTTTVNDWWAREASVTGVSTVTADDTDIASASAAGQNTTSGKGRLSHLIAVSIGAGDLDHMVRAELTQWPAALRRYVDNASPTSLLLLEQLSPALHFVWTSMDHLCIVWCNQLVRVTTRALFDAVDKETGQLTTNRTVLQKAFQWHFKENRGFKSVASGIQDVSPLNYSAAQKASEKGTRVYVSSVHKPLALYRLEIPPSLIGRTVFVLTNQQSDEFVLLCPHDVQRCSKLTHYRFAPPGLRFIHLHIDPAMIGYSFVFTLRHEKANKKPRLLLQHIYDQGHTSTSPTTHTATFDVGGVTCVTPLWAKEVSLKGSDSVFFNVTLRGFRTISQAFTVVLKPTRCDKYETEELSSVWFEVPGHPMLSLYRSFQYPYNAADDNLELLFHAVPRTPIDADPVLHLLLNPGCHYRLVVRSNPLASLMQIILHFAHLLPFMLVFLVLSLLSCCSMFSASQFSSPIILLWEAACFVILWIFCWTQISALHADALAVSLLCLTTCAVVHLGGLLLLVVFTLAYALRQRISPKPANGVADEFSLAYRLALFVVLTALAGGCAGFVACFVSLLFSLKLMTITSHDKWLSVDRCLQLFAHVLLVALNVPSGLVWAVEIGRGTWFLSPDPSARPAIVLIAMLFVPIPRRFQSVKVFLLLPLSVAALADTTDATLTSLACIVALNVGLQLNFMLMPPPTALAPALTAAADDNREADTSDVTRIETIDDDVGEKALTT